MDVRDLLRFGHCGTTIYTLDAPAAPAAPAGSAGLRCPVCEQAVRFGLAEAPVRIRSPISDGHRAACCFVITSRYGAAGFRDESNSELHVGISSSEGVLFSYTESGVQRQQVGWEQSIVVPLVTPGNNSLRTRWDEQLETFSRQNTWTADRFLEQREFGSCCYGFALSFINHMMRSEGSQPISRERFTAQHILPRLEAASRYLMVYEHISLHGHYSTAESHSP